MNLDIDTICQVVHYAAERFIQRRVFSQRVTAKRLIPVGSRYNLWTLSLSVLGRIFAKKQIIVDHHRVPSSLERLKISAYLGQLQGASSAIFNSITHPIGFYHDVSTDRWLHSLYDTEEIGRDHGDRAQGDNEANPSALSEPR